MLPTETNKSYIFQLLVPSRFMDGHDELVLRGVEQGP